jgi:hypothetical protein
MSEENVNVSPNSTIELIRVLNLSVISLGVKKVITLLKWFAKTNTNDNNQLTEMIIYSVCSKYKTTLKELIEGKRNDNDDYGAMCLLAFLLKKHALMKQTDIAKLLGRHKSQVSKYISRMTMLNTELYKDDRKLKTYYLEIDKSLQTLIHNEQITIWKNAEGEADLKNQITQ